jgi:hypothetical protein
MQVLTLPLVSLLRSPIETTIQLIAITKYQKESSKITPLLFTITMNTEVKFNISYFKKVRTLDKVKDQIHG